MAEKNSSEVTVIGTDTKIKGEMHFDAGARILGTVEGKISAGAQLEIGESAVCDAELEGARIVIDGEVRGNVNAREQLTLTQHARVQGDLTAGTLIVTDGATFVGHCRVGPRAEDMRATQRTTSVNTVSPVAVETKRPSTDTVTSSPASTPAASSGDAELSPPWKSSRSTDDAPIVETPNTNGLRERAAS